MSAQRREGSAWYLRSCGDSDRTKIHLLRCWESRAADHPSQKRGNRTAGKVCTSVTEIQPTATFEVHCLEEMSMLCGHVFLGSMVRPPCMRQTNGSRSRIVHCTRLCVATTAHKKTFDGEPWPGIVSLFLLSNLDAFGQRGLPHLVLPQCMRQRHNWKTEPQAGSNSLLDAIKIIATVLPYKRFARQAATCDLQLRFIEACDTDSTVVGCRYRRSGDDRQNRSQRNRGTAVELSDAP